MGLPVPACHPLHSLSLQVRAGLDAFFVGLNCLFAGVLVFAFWAAWARRGSIGNTAAAAQVGRPPALAAVGAAACMAPRDGMLQRLGCCLMMLHFKGK